MDYQVCSHCGQWINEDTKHYRIILKNGVVAYIHYHVCLNYYIPPTPMHRITVINHRQVVSAQTMYDDLDYIAERGGTDE